MKHKDLALLGWNDQLEAHWEEGKDYVPGRVIADYGALIKIAIPNEVMAEPAGRLHYTRAQMPKVGDWVAVQVSDGEHSVVHEVLPRKNSISRRQPGEKTEEQVLAVNVDVAFLVQSLDNDFSPQRLQRYLFQLNREEITPVIVLNKADQADDIQQPLDLLEPLGVEVLVVSAIEHRGMDEIARTIKPGETAVFLGSSGVGKSTITNALLGDERQVTRDARSTDSKGRHTTSHRELFMLPDGGLIIDTPGLRELQLWGTEDDLGASFPDIETLAAACKFDDCSHDQEPGCAVLEARDAGTLDASRFEQFIKFQKELQFLASKLDEGAAQERKEGYKKAQRQYNHLFRSKDR